MNKVSLFLVASTALVGLSVPASAAIVVHTTSFITSPTNFNGFEAIAGDPSFVSPFFFPSNTTYSEGGIDVSYVGGATLWLQYQYAGNFGWYANGGGIGYTSVRRTGGGDIGQIEFLAGTGFNTSELIYELRNGGVVVATGVAGPVVGGFGNSGLRTYGFSGGGFDEVRLQANSSGTFNGESYEAGAYDSFTIGSSVPEPAAWALMIAGFGLVGAAARRRQRVSVSYA